MTQDVPDLPLSAIFIDLDNMAIGVEGQLLDFDIARVMAMLSARSRPIVRVAYADWVMMERFRRPFTAQGFDLVQITYVNQTKNGADIQMCVDALTLALRRPEIGTIALVTADSDFAPLIRALRREGRTVLTIGRENKVNALMRAQCDAFIAYESLPGPGGRNHRPRPRPVPNGRPDAPEEALDLHDPRDLDEDGGPERDDLITTIGSNADREGG